MWTFRKCNASKLRVTMRTLSFISLPPLGIMQMIFESKWIVRLVLSTCLTDKEYCRNVRHQKDMCVLWHAFDSKLSWNTTRPEIISSEANENLCKSWEVRELRYIAFEGACDVNLSLSCRDAANGSRCCHFLVDSAGAVAKKCYLPEPI